MRIKSLIKLLGEFERVIIKDMDDVILFEDSNYKLEDSVLKELKVSKFYGIESGIEIYVTL